MTECTEPTTPAAPSFPPATRSQLSASDAEVLVAIATQKREAAQAGGDAMWRATLQAEAQGLEAMALALRDPSQRGVPPLYVGNGNEVTPKDNFDFPWRLRECS